MLAFFTPRSGCPAPLSVNSPSDCAKIIQSSKVMKLENGMVVAGILFDYKLT